jgi:hypothetical protein
MVLQVEPTLGCRWGAIATFNLMTRVGTLPLAIYSQKITASVVVGEANVPTELLVCAGRQTLQQMIIERKREKVLQFHLRVIRLHSDLVPQCRLYRNNCCQPRGCRC